MPTFDGDNLVMTLDAPTDGVLTQDVEVAWYNAWKDWMLAAPENRKYPPVFYESFGGDDLTPGIQAGAYFKFQNQRGWRVRPYEADQTIYVVGNLTPADSTLPMVIPTLGAYTVLFDGLQPVTQNVDLILTEQRANVLSLQRLIEALRPHHTGTGNIWYWNPYGGDDTNNGIEPTTAVKTFARAHTLAVDNNHDIIICMPGDPSGKTKTTENIAITKNFLFVRGPGRDFEINSANDSLDAIEITSNGVELSGFVLSTSPTNTEHAVHTSGNFTLIKDVWVGDAANGIHLAGGEYHVLDNVRMHHNAGFGLLIDGDCDHVDVVACHIGNNGGNGVDIDLSGGHEVHFLGDTVIHNNSGYGVNISATTSGVIIQDTAVFANVLGDINDLGADTYNSNTFNMTKDLWQFKGCDPANSVARGGDQVTEETLTVDGEVITITPTTISRS